jgi:predicted dehydrogenase
VYICTWTSEHPRLVAAACARGLPVFCEKPLAVDLDRARQMVAVVDQARSINQVGLILRWSPAFGLLRALAQDVSTNGRPMSVVFRDDQYIPIQGMYSSTWRADVTKAGAGTLLEHSIHDLDLLEHVLGPVASVSAQTSDFHEIDGIEDGAAVLLRFVSGALGTLSSVWHDVLERPSLRRVELLSERCHTTVEGDWYGPVEWQVTGAALERREGDALEVESARRGAVLGNPDGAFIQSIVEGRPAWPSFADALRAHVLADAVYRSAAEGGTLVEIGR